MNWVQWCWVNRNWMDRGWVNGNCVDGGGVDRFGMNGGWLVSWWWMSNTIIFHISYVSTIATDISCIVDNLDAAIRKGHLVLASHDVGIRCLFLVEAGTRVVVMDAILESIGFGGLSIAPMDWLVMNGHGVDWQWVDGDNWRVDWDQRVGSVGC